MEKQTIGHIEKSDDRKIYRCIYEKFAVQLSTQLRYFNLYRIQKCYIHIITFFQDLFDVIISFPHFICLWESFDIVLSFIYQSKIWNIVVILILSIRKKVQKEEKLNLNRVCVPWCNIFLLDDNVKNLYVLSLENWK